MQWLLLLRSPKTSSVGIPHRDPSSVEGLELRHVDRKKPPPEVEEPLLLGSLREIPLVLRDVNFLHSKSLLQKSPTDVGLPLLLTVEQGSHPSTEEGFLGDVSEIPLLLRDESPLLLRDVNLGTYKLGLFCKTAVQTKGSFFETKHYKHRSRVLMRCHQERSLTTASLQSPTYH